MIMSKEAVKRYKKNKFKKGGKKFKESLPNMNFISTYRMEQLSLEEYNDTGDIDFLTISEKIEKAIGYDKNTRFSNVFYHTNIIDKFKFTPNECIKFMIMCNEFTSKTERRMFYHTRDFDRINKLMLQTS